MVLAMVGDWLQVKPGKSNLKEPITRASPRLPLWNLRKIWTGLLGHLNKLIHKIYAVHRFSGAPPLRVEILVLMVCLGLVNSACRPTKVLLVPLRETAPLPSPSPAPMEILSTPVQEIPATFIPLVSLPLPSPPPTSTQAATPLPVHIPTPDLYQGFTIAYLSSRSYGGGEFQFHQTLEDDPGFTRYLFSYPSDGLTIYGFLNVPKQDAGPYPVVIALHGYIDPAIYNTLDYTTPYADILARAGYMVFHPNLRGYSPSDNGPNLFRVGMAVDVLNLIALIKEQAGTPGILESARPEGFGLWGHSMGGGISLRVTTLSPDIRAAVLYGAMSGDEKRNFEAITEWSEYQRGLEELGVPEIELQRISPIYYLDRINASISIHHGEQDQLVPLEWSLELYRQLSELGKQVECVTYPGQLHTFNAQGRELFMNKVIELFDRELK
jgi:uncharacterized protein